MMYRLLLLLCLGLSYFPLNAQSITIEKAPATLCFETDVDIPVQITGTFAATNQFAIGIEYDGYQYSEFPAQWVLGNKLRIRLGQHTFNYLRPYGRYRMKVVATSPAFTSNWSDYNSVGAYPILNLGEHSFQLNKYSQAKVPFTASSDMTITLQDSSSRDTLQFKFYTSDNLFKASGEQTFTFDKPVSYYVKSIQNSCGTNTGTGFIRVKTNPVSIQATLVTPFATCEGNPAYVNFSTEGGNWVNGNTFKIRLIPQLNPGQETPNQYVDTDATLENGSLKFTVPSVLSRYNTNRFSVRIVSSNPKTVSPYNNLWMVIASAPTAELFTNEPTRVPYGSAVSINVKVKGISPYHAILSDGTQTSGEGGYNDPTEGSFSVKYTNPLLQNQTYTLSSVQTGCGPAKITGNPISIALTKGLLVDSLPTKDACDGQVFRFRIQSNQNLNGPVKVRFNANLSTGTAPHEIQGTIAQNWVSFVASPYVNDSDQEVRTVNVSLDFGDYQTNNLFYIDLHGKPTARFREYYKNITIDAPQSYELAFMTTGSYRNIVTFSDGSQSTYDNPWYKAFYIQRSETYSIVKVSNLCYSTDLKDDCVVTVRNPNNQGILLKKPASVACRDQKLAINFDTYGEFQPGNTFKIQYSDSYSNYKDFESGVVNQKGSYSLTLPEETRKYGSIYVRIISTAPEKISESFYINLAGEARLRYQNYTREIKAGSTSSYFAEFDNNYPPLAMVVSDGTREWTLSSPSERSLQANFSPTQTTYYKIRSISNVCGTVNLPNTSFKITVITNDSLRVSWPASARLENPCLQGKIKLPFVVRGKPNANTTYTLQVSTRTDYNAPLTFVDLVQTKQAGFFEFEWPASNPVRSFAFRIMTSNPATHSDTLWINAVIPPQVVLSSPNQMVEGGQSVSLNAEFKNGSYGTIYWSDGFVSSYSRSVTVQKKTTYTIRSVSNQCGYGTATGEVTVRVKPVLNLTTVSHYELCRGATVTAGFSFSGDYDESNYFVLSLINTKTRKAIRMDSTRTGTGPFSLKIPANFTPGLYTLELASTSPVIRTSRSLRILSVPEYRLLGSTIINPGQSTTLQFVTPHQTGEFVSYTLSDNSTGTFYADGYAFINVKPTQTTTYTVRELVNTCGKTAGTGSATVTVNPPSERTVSVIDAVNANYYSRICAGDTLYVSYATTGTFSANNRFSIQISDSTGTNFKTINTLPWGQQRLKALVPETLPRASGYRVMVVASDPNTASAASGVPMTVAIKPTARLLTQTAYALPGQKLSVPIELTGDPNWQVELKNEFSSLSFSLTLPIDTLTFDRQENISVYKLASVVNGCGVGRVIEPSQLRVELVTSVELPTVSAIEVFPNPATEKIRINVGRPGTHQVRLYSLTGTLLSESNFSDTYIDLDVSDLPMGTYLLRFLEKGNTQTFRIIKH
ncbi:hypothetical protein BWI97_05455 [Siphonobacter sp. BAB-5405]|uniref:T9SS type A sorting domain-containing protein n=1 Tax=Siphonobacter sp. BAB-5405 TaxID=1864825 RepID=UPI000C80AD3C|nr:T9SS type A sorting domain-containing protein [Siphonobacter sp. BAB-5405]PMD98132.1 hypothetical protein BWI97_05455 [Siphonobacter sp. BAB-5405]